MNIFFIPSWYPSADEPIVGTFSKEQAEAIAKEYPESNLGISLWGQMTENNLLWAKDHFKNLVKILQFRRQKVKDISLKNNYVEYYTPALTWTDRILKGNINNIINANDTNLHRFEAHFGKVSLIHAHVAFPAGYIAMQLAQKYKIPYIITEQMSPFPFDCYIRKGKIMSKVFLPLKKADAVIAISPYSEADIRSKVDINPVCIPNLVDESLFLPSENKLQLNPFLFFTLGRMVPQKGIPDLLYAISLMNNQQARFQLGGDGENKLEYEKLAKRLSINERIEWLGELSRSEVATRFQQCHAFVLSSIHESMGVVFVEALACGKPIIASRSGGPEFIVNKDNGLLVDLSSPEQLASAMDYVIDNYSQYNPKKIREGFMERFSSKTVSAQIYSLYKSII